MISNNKIKPLTYYGLTESVKGKFRDKKQIKSLDSVIISVQKLYNLSENILNVKFIEDLLFGLKKIPPMIVRLIISRSFGFIFIQILVT